MKRLLLSALLLLLVAGNASAITDLSLGIYGGLNYPLAQDDAKSGSGFGVRAKVSPIPLIAGALFYETRSFGDPEITVFDQTSTADGGKVSVFGVEAMLGNVGGGMGPHFYFMAGLGNYKWTRDGMESLSKVAYHLGPGLEIVVPPSIGIEARIKLEIVPTGGGGSRKNAAGFLGLNYHFGFGVM